MCWKLTSLTLCFFFISFLIRSSIIHFYFSSVFLLSPPVRSSRAPFLPEPFNTDVVHGVRPDQMPYHPVPRFIDFEDELAGALHLLFADEESDLVGPYALLSDHDMR